MSYSEPSNGIRYATKRIPKKLPAPAVAVGVGKDEAVSQKAWILSMPGVGSGQTFQPTRYEDVVCMRLISAFDVSRHVKGDSQTPPVPPKEVVLHRL